MAQWNIVMPEWSISFHIELMRPQYITIDSCYVKLIILMSQCNIMMSQWSCDVVRQDSIVIIISHGITCRIVKVGLERWFSS